jgi:DNA-binding SARP family transcriptional activator
MSESVDEATGVRFTLLGPLTVHGERGPVALGGARTRCLLAALLLRAGQVTSVDQLIDFVWSPAAPAGARVLVQNRVSALRRVLRDAGLGQELITTVGSSYLLQVEAGQLDLHLFDRRLARADLRSAAGDAAAATAELTAALDLWRGPALDGLTTPPIATAAKELEERRIRAVKQRIALDLGRGRHAELVGELTGLVTEHPYQEDLRGLLLLALGRSGRAGEALAFYRDTRTLFAEQLGIEPSPALARVHDAILREEPVELVDLTGLADVPGPARPAGVPVRVPAPRRLPSPPAGFTGREEQLRRLDALLTAGTDPAPARITTIDGMAGVGKSALALQWAHLCAEQFPDGQLHVDLHGDRPTPRPPIEALDLLLGALGHARADIPTDLDRAAALYRSSLATRRLLVLLDNARSAEQVRPLLPGSPGSSVLITSRNRLSGLVAREGANRITLDVLEPAEANRFLALALGEDRVRAEPRATTRLAAHCGYLPLALQAAAANLTGGRYTRVNDQVTELDAGDRLTALAGDPRRPQRLRSAFDRSYHALPAPGRRLFRLLGLVPGTDFTAPAAAALAGLDVFAAESTLDQLAAVHLIQEHAPGRFRLHKLVRQHAAERAGQLDAAERTRALRRLLGWYLRHACTAAALARCDGGEVLLGGASREAGWLEVEWANLVAAVRHSPDWLARLLADTLRGHLDATVRRSGPPARPLARWPEPRAGRTPVRAGRPDQSLAVQH